MDCEVGPKNTMSGSGISTNEFLNFAYLGMSLFLNKSFLLDIENLAVRFFPLKHFEHNPMPYCFFTLVEMADISCTVHSLRLKQKFCFLIMLFLILNFCFQCFLLFLLYIVFILFQSVYFVSFEGFYFPLCM